MTALPSWNDLDALVDENPLALRDLAWQLRGEVERLEAASRTERARDDEDVPLFIHGCGTVMPSSVSGVKTGEHHRYPPCTKPGPWRPLFVAEEVAR